MKNISFHTNKRLAEKEQPKKFILVVEDDAATGDLLVEVLTQELNCGVLGVSQGNAALEVLSLIKPDMFILDYRLPAMNGIELYDHIYAQQVFEDVPCILVSAGPIVHELENRNMTIIMKPFDLDELIGTITKALKLDNTK